MPPGQLFVLGDNRDNSADSRVARARRRRRPVADRQSGRPRRRRGRLLGSRHAQPAGMDLAVRVFAWRGFSPRCIDAGARMTFDDVREHRAGLAGGRGRHLLRHAGAEGAQEAAGAAEGRRRQPGDAGRPATSATMLVESQPKVFYFTDHYRDYPMVLIRLSKAKRASRAAAAPALAAPGARRRARRDIGARGRLPGDRNCHLPHHARGKPRLAPRRLDVFFQEAVRFPAGIARPRIGPGAAFVVGGAGGLAGVVALARS